MNKDYFILLNFNDTLRTVQEINQQNKVIRRNLVQDDIQVDFINKVRKVNCGPDKVEKQI